MAMAYVHTLAGAVASKSLPESLARLNLLQSCRNNSLSPSFLSRCPRTFSGFRSPGNRIGLLRVFASFSTYVQISPMRPLVPGQSRSRAVAGASSLSSSSSMEKITPEDVLQFWFKDIDPQNNVYARKAWFRGGSDFDKECEEKFGGCLKLASIGALDGWMATVRGKLALVILLDQIFRNVYRNSPSAFSQDEKALKITLETIEQGLDKELVPWERRFLYMPLMHSENLGDHEIAEHVFKNLADENVENKELHQALLDVLEFERKHVAVLKKFKRYPGRNVALGRSSTKEEEDFLSNNEAW